MNAIRIPPKRIVVPLDFSDLSFRAWRFARGIARLFDAKIEAVYADDSIVLEMPPLPQRPMDRAIRRELEGFLRKKIGSGSPIHIVEGATVPMILRSAARLRADLIVMGTHGRAGLPRALFGSVTEAMARASSVPILALRRHWQPIRSILAPLNFQPYAQKGFLAAAEYARALGARLTALYVEDASAKLDAPRARRLFDSMMERLPQASQNHRKPDLIVRRGDPVVKILSAASDYDLVVLVSHKKSLLKDLVLGTTAERVLRHCPVPVLSWPEGASSAAALARRERVSAGG